MACTLCNVAGQAAPAVLSSGNRPPSVPSPNAAMVRLHSPNLVRTYVHVRPVALAAGSKGAQPEGAHLQSGQQKGRELRQGQDSVMAARRRLRDPSLLLLDSWDPFSRGGLRQMMDTVDQLMIDNVAPSGASTSRGATRARASVRTPWDVVEDEEGFHIRVDMPGFGKGDVKVCVEDGVLAVNGQRIEDPRWAAKSYSKFKTRLALPENARLDKISAELKNGVLFVAVPKVKPEERKQMIDIQVS